MTKYITTIPVQLRNPTFMFNLLGAKSKVAIEQEWQTKNNYRYNDLKLLKHLASGKNYGLLGGYGNLALIDSDKTEIEKLVEANLPDTFTVLTGTGKKHYIYQTEKPIKPIRLSKEKIGDFGDVRSLGQYIVGCNSIHPCGNPYKVFKERAIASISIKDIETTFKDYIDGTVSFKTKKEYFTDTTKRSTAYINLCKVPDYLANYKIKSDTSKNWMLFKYIADIGYNRGVSTEFFHRLCEKQGHNFGAISGWIEKARQGQLEKSSCEKMRDYLQRFHPELISIICGECINLKNEEKNFNQEKTKSEDDILKKYIFDPNQVQKKKIFVSCKINDFFGYGVFLPKNIDLFDRKGNLVSTDQINAPVILASDNKVYEISKELQKKFMIKFEPIPTELNLRLSLPSIKKYLKGEYGKVDGIKLFNRIKRAYQKFLYFSSDGWYKVHALWDMDTYFFLLFRAYPILELRGLKRTAKTKIMTISSFITFNATEIMVDPSEATLFRETHEKRPTKYIDEAEKLFRIERGKIAADQRVEVINSSYYYKGCVPRIEKIGNRFVTVYYKTYSPTMLGSINGLYGATEDRAIIHITVKNPDDDTRGDLEPSEDDPEWQEIRDDLYIFALQNWKEIEHLYNNLENQTNLKDRDFQLWKPLLVISKFLDEDLYSRIKEFAERLTTIKKIDGVSEGSVEFNLLQIVYELLQMGKDKILIKDVHDSYPITTYRPSHRSIGKHLDRFGFMEFKQHTRDGNAYFITKNIFESIVQPICPSIFHSHTSHTSHSYIDNEKISEESVKDGEDGVKVVKQVPDVKQNDTSDFDKFDKKCLVFTKCSVEGCFETECNFDEHNNPYCKQHWDNKRGTIKNG